MLNFTDGLLYSWYRKRVQEGLTRIEFFVKFWSSIISLKSENVADLIDENDSTGPVIFIEISTGLMGNEGRRCNSAGTQQFTYDIKKSLLRQILCE